MKATISNIALFSFDCEVRLLSFTEGLNIITGDSKTGKSALIEIVDFCLFAKRSTIPVGKVTEWTQYFSVVYEVGSKSLIIVRSLEKINDCYFAVESNFDVEKELTCEYLETLNLKKIKDAQIEFEQHLGLSVTSTKESNSQEPQTGGKASIRDAASLMFQHQNLIANKHSIFYRFDNYYKRLKVVSDFPIHLGWADGKYFALKRGLERLQKQLKKNAKVKVSLKESNESQRLRLEKPIESYYNSLGMVLDKGLSLPKLLKVAKSLPEVPNTVHENSNLLKQLKTLRFQRDELKKDLVEIEGLITVAGDNSGDANEYAQSMRKLIDLSEVEIDESNIICPLCGTESLETQALVEEVKESRIDLIGELSKVGVFKSDNSEFLSELMIKRDKLKEEIKTFRKPIYQLKKALDIAGQDSLKAGLYTLKGRIEENLERIIEENVPEKKTDDPESLDSRISKIESELSGYDIKSKREEANVFINETMNSLIKKLDFEKELRSGEVRFDLENFDFHFLYKSKKISLSEMGSGANWLACHLSLFLALLKLTIRENSSFPAVLFFDQPSQVYFPKVKRRFSSAEKSELMDDIENDSDRDEVDENLKQVVNFFTVINDFLDDMVKDELINFKPQIIVLEHADEPELDKYVIKRWSTQGEKLI